MTKPLIVHPGAESSVHDCYVGLIAGWKAHGWPMAEFRLDARIDRAYGWLHYLYRRSKKRDPLTTWPTPTPADVLYHASMGLVERALDRGCDAILAVTAMYLQPDSLILAKRAGLRVYLLCTESPYDLQQELRLAALADGVWTTERTTVSAFAAACAHAAYLPHAWRPGFHDRSGPHDHREQAHDVVFVGTFFDERRRWLEAVEWAGVDLGLYGNTHLIPKRSPLRPYVRDGLVSNDRAAALYRRAKIGLNLYREPPVGHEGVSSLNPRAYELAGAGTCYVSQARGESEEIFGELIPTFSTSADLETLIRMLLADEDRRRQIGQAAQQAVSGHTWPARARRLQQDIERWEYADQLHSRRSA